MKIYLSRRKLCETCSNRLCVRYDCRMGADEKCETCCGDENDSTKKCHHIHSLDLKYTCGKDHSDSATFRYRDKCEQCCKICRQTYARSIARLRLFEFYFRQAGMCLHDVYSGKLKLEKCYCCDGRFFLMYKTLDTQGSFISIQVATTWEQIHAKVQSEEEK